MFNESQLLKVWENGYGKRPYIQALLMLGLALPGKSIQQLLKVSLGQRDSLLLQLRKSLFGERLETLAECGACGEQLEFSFGVSDILADKDWSPELYSVAVGQREIQFRLPDTSDIIAAQKSALPPSEAIVRQCVARQQELLDLSTEELQTVTQAISNNDPQSEVVIDLTCANCQAKFQTQFDVVSFLWTEVNAWAERLLTEIHSLARAYHWTEAEILGLGSWRRQVYLNMVRQ